MCRKTPPRLVAKNVHVNTFVYNPATSARTIARALRPDALMKLGHRRFGLVAQTTPNNDRAAAAGRLQGIQDALAAPANPNLHAQHVDQTIAG
jgi:DNA-binding LacI/PurR family transcriptional regulator